jgi:hypothetical protein
VAAAGLVLITGSALRCARSWRWAGQPVPPAASGPEAPLARRPYGLRRAAVSTWLNVGVPSTQIAAWAGHCVGVLDQIYAKVIVGQEDAARRRIDAVLGGY